MAGAAEVGRGGRGGVGWGPPGWWGPGSGLLGGLGLAG
jgi:hypothetical protein